jgi:transaldolase/transaldolase/glucose-6-phosphate isomerase
VEALIGAETVTTVPLETLHAYRDHGDPKDRIEDDLDQIERLLAQLPQLDVSIEKVTQQLENEGVEKFIVPFDRLLATIGEMARRNWEAIIS